MAPGNYTELFFLDEATALAAGHRPCAECRRNDYKSFLHAWIAGHGLGSRPSAGEIDAALHRARVDRRRKQVTFSTEARSLPDGAMIGVDGEPWLVWNGARHRWTFGGYREQESLPASA
ncbi:MAG TPA: hypothetical protein VFE52_11650, partial [Devosia sp.]|nr:hypothetical protein [Devosia sp.]